MGNWNINIQGVGCHHNADNPNDINLLVKEFVEKILRYHTVESATLTYGGKEDILSSVQKTSI